MSSTADVQVRVLYMRRFSRRDSVGETRRDWCLETFYNGDTCRANLMEYWILVSSVPMFSDYIWRTVNRRCDSAYGSLRYYNSRHVRWRIWGGIREKCKYNKYVLPKFLRNLRGHIYLKIDFFCCIFRKRNYSKKCP